MRVEPAVSEMKFKGEVERLSRQATTLRQWGCFVVRTEYPEIDAIFVPRKRMRLSLQVTQSLTGLFLSQPGLASQDLPSLAARAFGIRLRLDDFDQRAPSAVFHDPWTWEPLKMQDLPLGQNMDENGNTLTVVLDDHPTWHRPFICLRGFREYHEHPQHTGDDWQLYRREIGVFTLLSTIWRTCVELARPNLILVPNLVQIRWEAEKPRR